MDIKFDGYTWRARVLPVYLTAAPAVLAIAATLPEGLVLPLASASAIVFVPLSYFMSQVASDFGKSLEPRLWRSWGGPPTTRFLRHDNDEFNPKTRERVHERLRALGLDIPTANQEKVDRARALEMYASAVDELRRLTRDTERFPLVYKGNTEYGFRRNLLAHVLFAPHHGRKSGRVPKDWLEKIDPTIIVVGEAPSSELTYYDGWDTITQNSAGDIVFECLSGKTHVFVSESTYSVDFLTKEQGVGSRHGGYYIGTFYT